MPRALNLQGLRVNGSQGPNGFRGPKNIRVSGFKGSGIPCVKWGFLTSGVSKIQRFQVPRDEGFSWGSKVWDKRDKGLLGPCRSKGLKVPRALRVFPKFNGEGLGFPIINVSTLISTFDCHPVLLEPCSNV